jgi:hypothetical protein
MNKISPSSLIINWFWTLSILTSLLLLIITLILVVQSDESRQSEVYAYLTGPQQTVLLHVRPEPQSGISALLKRGTKVTVLELSPEQKPTWVYVQQSESRGWIQIEYLMEGPP